MALIFIVDIFLAFTIHFGCHISAETTATELGVFSAI